MQKQQISFAEKESRTFEIDMIIRDSLGKPMLDANGNMKRRSYSHNNPYKISEFWNRYKGKPKKKKRHLNDKEKKEALAAVEELNKKNEQKLIEREKLVEKNDNNE